jgi:hypothetical protein
MRVRCEIMSHAWAFDLDLPVFIDVILRLRLRQKRAPRSRVGTVHKRAGERGRKSRSYLFWKTRLSPNGAAFQDYPAVALELTVELSIRLIKRPPCRGGPSPGRIGPIWAGSGPQVPTISGVIQHHGSSTNFMAAICVSKYEPLVGTRRVP